MSFKEAAVDAVLPGDDVVKLNAADERNPARADLALLQRRYRNLWSFYVFLDGALIDRRGALGQLSESVFGWPNVYRP